MIETHPNAANILLTYPTEQAAIEAAAQQWVVLAQKAIAEKGNFYVALSGGSTPKAIYTLLSTQYAQALNWQAVHLYWSDERYVPLDHPDSNYRMAMLSGLISLPIPKQNIHPVPTHLPPELCAQSYNSLLADLPDKKFDLIMLGMGTDGHTASLFPHTQALNEPKRYFVANLLSDGKTYRMTLTYPGLHAGKQCIIYALGKEKKERIQRVFEEEYNIQEQPIQGVGTKEAPAYWIIS